MNKLKIKNLNEAKLEKAKEVFKTGLTVEDDQAWVEYEVEDNKITVGGIEATFTKEVKDIKGFDLIKDITITVSSKHLTNDIVMHWLKNDSDVWIVHRLVNSLIAVARKSKAGSGMSKEDLAKLKAEIARYRAMKKAK